MARPVIRLGAAAFVLGITLAGPQAIAAADGPDAAAPADSAGSAGPANASRTAGPQNRSGQPAQRTGRPAVPATVIVPAAAAQAEAVGTTRQATVAPGARRAHAARSGSDGRAALVVPTSRPAPGMSAGPTASPTQSGVPDPAAQDAAGQEPVAAPAEASPPTAGAGGIATARVPAAAATDSSADLLGGALAPVQAFIEGIGLLIRRTFFNQAPTVTPVQLTGQVAGTITGTVGAVDPEGDPITYRLTADPVFGTVQIGPDGSYLYTPGDGFAGTDTFTVAAADSGLHINLLDLFRPAYTLGNPVVTQGLTGPRIQFQFNYGAGAVFWSQEARAALEASATILASYFVVSAPVTVTYTVNGELSPLSGTLASASSDMISSGSGFFPTVVQQKIIAGVDVNGAVADGEISWNFANPWALGATVDRGQYDFQSVAIHELLHTFGFLSNVGSPGTNDGTGWTAFDGFVVTADGTGVIGPGYRWDGSYDTNLNGGDGGLFFGGPTAIAVYGGPVPLFTPSPWQGGSSVSHLDDMSFYGRDEKLMNAQVSTGAGIRSLSAVETAILTDLGYTTVPAPGTPALLLVGFLLLRRRRDSR